MAGSVYPGQSPGQRRRLELQVLLLQSGIALVYSIGAYTGLFDTDGAFRRWSVTWILGYHALHAVYILGWRMRRRPIRALELFIPLADVSSITAAWLAIGDPASPMWAIYLYALVGYSRRVAGRAYLLVAFFIIANVAILQIFLVRQVSGAWIDGNAIIRVVFTVFMALLASAIGSAWRTAERTARRLAETDPLTGIANRRTFLERLSALADGRDARFSVLMLDLDDFKQLNDAHGHIHGDDVLAEVARLLAAHLRPGDRVARYGGEEFVIMLPGAGLEEAVATAERLRSAVKEGTPTSVSIGCVERMRDEPAAMVVRRADELLLVAKRTGKNVVVTAAPAIAA